MKKVSKEQLAEMSRECLSNNINRTARIITRLYDENTRPYGYLTTQIQMLYMIAYWEPVSINTLASKADVERTTALRNCTVLEKKGLLSIKTGEDKRFRLVELTGKGWDVVNESYSRWHKEKAAIEKKLGKKEIEKLVEMLRAAGKLLRK